MIKDAVAAVPFAWWRPDNYARVLEISVDKENLWPTFREWRNAAQKGFDQLRADGLPVVKVMIDPEELLKWATAEGRAIDGKARAEFAVVVHERENRQRH